MPPEYDEGRPGRRAASHVEVHGEGSDFSIVRQSADMVSEMRRLVEDVHAQRRREQQAREEGFRDGLALGLDLAEVAWRIGHAHRDHQIAENHRRIAAEALGDGRTHDRAELTRWDGPREDFGKPRPGDFPGVGAQEVA